MRALLSLCLVAVPALGCADKDDSGPESPPPPEAPSPAPAQRAPAQPSYRPIEVRNGGKITGRVSFAGPIPEDAVERYPIPGNSEACGRGYRELVTIDVGDGALRNSFVFIDGIDEGKPWPDDVGYAEIDQVDCKFVPPAQIARRGPIKIKNSDLVLHNVNAREVRGVEKGRILMKSLFNIAQATKGEIQQSLKRTKSPFIALACESHNFMAAHILAPGHPYATVVDADGSYEIDAVPPGDYTLKAWHPKLGLQQRSVSVAANGSVEVDFEFSR